MKEARLAEAGMPGLICGLPQAKLADVLGEDFAVKFFVPVEPYLRTQEGGIILLENGELLGLQQRVIRQLSIS